MTTADLLALLPIIVVSIGAVLTMLAIAVRRNHTAAATLSFAVLAASFASIWAALPHAPRQVTDLIVIDGYALFYMGLVLAASAVVVLLCHAYFEPRRFRREELYVLLLISTAGALVLVASSHFASFVLGLEILTAPLFALIAYIPGARRGVEAGIKYLILAAASVAFLLFGMALIYFELGTMEFGRIAAALRGDADFASTLLIPGFVFVISAFGFKLAIVPFHLWTPDVYEGAPAPVAAFIATVSKGAMLALLMRYFYHTGTTDYPQISILFTTVAIASMVGGNLLALLQDNVKRILAYSSIAHLGYVLVAFNSAGEFASQAVAYYLVAYFVTIIGAFGVVSALSDASGEPGAVRDFTGLFWQRPWLGVIFTAMLLSLAGIPLTAGFFGKYYVLTASASSRTWLLAITLAVTSAVGVYYYLRILVALYSRPTESTRTAAVPVRLAAGATLALCAVLLIWFGAFPAPLMSILPRL